MRYIFNIFLIIFSQFILCAAADFINLSNIQIKVLLNETSTTEDIIKISSANGLILKSPTNKIKKITSELKVQNIDDSLHINNTKIPFKIIQIDSVDGNLKYNNREYQGSFFIHLQNNKILLINKVELEDYIYSVLNTESWPGWPLEVNKVFAIAARSYVISKFLETKKNKVLYHIKNTNKHQTYSGMHNSKILKEATLSTTGIIIAYNKKPALAMFDCCCGGIIPANIQGINFKDAPYLERKHPCNFCNKCKLYSWKIEYNKTEFEKILKSEFPNLSNLKSINILKDKAGLAQNIQITDLKSQYISNGKKFYSLFNKIKSFCFSVNKKSEKITLTGNGYGHHLGICQWGAREMVNRGWDYKSILKFYYPGISLMKLKNR